MFICSPKRARYMAITKTKHDIFVPTNWENENHIEIPVFGNVYYSGHRDNGLHILMDDWDRVYHVRFTEAEFDEIFDMEQELNEFIEKKEFEELTLKNREG